jgi:hypothetical protein
MVLTCRTYGKGGISVVGKRGGKRVLGGSRCRGEDNIRMDHKEKKVGTYVLDSSGSEERVQRVALVNTMMYLPVP